MNVLADGTSAGNSTNVLYKFTPVGRSLVDNSTGNTYHLGLQYLVREGNEHMITLIERWLKQNKVEKVSGSSSTMGGSSSSSMQATQE